jgi:hypothetical protein
VGPEGPTLTVVATLVPWLRTLLTSGSQRKLNYADRAGSIEG